MDGGSPAFREISKKEEPNFEVSGILAEDQNQRNGVPLMFSIAVDSGVPDADECDWRLFEFDDADNSVIHRLRGSSCFLFGSDERLVLDAVEGDITYIYLRDESCSRQHAVIQFRNTNPTTPRPYLMDLNSSNGTVLNRKRIESGRYVELRHQDAIEFGRLGQDYVLLNAKVS
jgi:smad nuclear-interacting protein 1